MKILTNKPQKLYFCMRYVNCMRCMLLRLFISVSCIHALFMQASAVLITLNSEKKEGVFFSLCRNVKSLKCCEEIQTAIIAELIRKQKESQLKVILVK